MKEQQKWWQQPQPAWLMLLLSTAFVFAILGAWNVAQSVFAAESQSKVETTTSQTGGVIPYQGFLTDANGQPLNDTVNIQVQLFNASSVGTSLFPSEQHSNVPVTDGLFNIAIGSQTPSGVPSTVWDSTSVYVQVTVNGETLSPREKVGIPSIADTFKEFPDGIVLGSQQVSLLSGRAKASSSLDLTDSDQPIPINVTLNLPSPHTVLVVTTVDIATNNSTGVATMLLNGSASGYSGGQIIYAGIGRGTVSQSYIMNLPAGQHTLGVRARKIGSGSGFIDHGHTTISYIAFAQQ